MRFLKTRGSWLNHRKNVHSSEVAYANSEPVSDIGVMCAYRTARAAVVAALPEPGRAMGAAYVRDVNNAYDAILAHERILEGERYKNGRKVKRKRQRTIEAMIEELEEHGFEYESRWDQQ
jgi:hypothetical protein